MYKKVLCLVLSLVMVMSLLAGCGSSQSGKAPAPAANAGKKVFKFVHADSAVPDSAYEIYARYFKDYLEKASGGKWTIEVVGNAAMGSEPDVIVQLKMGQLDGSFITNISYSNVDPDMNFALLPYCFRNYKEVNTVLDDPAFLELQTKSLLKYGNVYAFGAGHMGFRHMLFGQDFFGNLQQPLNVDAIKGKKIRTTETPITVGVFNALGAVPTAMTSAEMITALQQKTVDGCSYSVLPSNSYGLNKGIIKSMLLTRHFYVYAFMAYSAKFWNSLSPEEQGWFKEASLKAGVDQRAAVEKMEQEYLEKFKSQNGIRIYETDMKSFIDKSKPAYDKFRGTVDPDLMKRVEEILAKLRT